MKSDEKELLETLQRRTKQDDHVPMVRQAILDIDINQKRAVYILSKWCDKGWYEFGVSIMSGWLTDKGLEIETK